MVAFSCGIANGNGVGTQSREPSQCIDWLNSNVRYLASGVKLNWLHLETLKCPQNVNTHTFIVFGSPEAG